MLQVTEIRDDGELDELRPEWDDLLGRSRHAGIFQTPEWLTSCRQHFGRGKRMATLGIRDEGRLVGLAPLEIARMYGTHLRRLQFIGNGRSDYLDFITDADTEEDALSAIFSWLAEHRTDWDVMDLQQIPEGSPTGSSVSSPHSCPIPNVDTLSQELCPYMPLAASWEGTIAGLGKKTRYNLGYYERLMRRRFDCIIHTLSPENLEEGMGALFDLHTSRWQKRWPLRGVLSGDRTRRFHRDLAARFAERGWLRLHGLKLDGEYKAVLYCLAYKSKAYYYIGGFDPELSKYSLGTILTGYAIRQAVDEGLREFDFLRGNEHYKTHWTGHSRMNARLLGHGDGLRSSASAAVCRMEMKIEHAAKKAMHKRFGGS